MSNDDELNLFHLAVTALGVRRLEKPKGLDSPLAIEAALHAIDVEKSALIEKIQANHRGPRRPALEGRQYPACPGVSYRIYDNLMNDDALVVGFGESGWGRMVRLPGKVLVALSGHTNAPPGERGLIDDDLETILNTQAYEPMHFQPWMPLKEGDADTEEIAETNLLQRELFFSDPVLREHVGRAVDINPKLFLSEEHAATFHKGLERAWDLAWGGPPNTVESIALARACERCDVMMNMRRSEET